MPKPTGPQFIHLLNEQGHKRKFKALYHGTRVELNEGDIIDPEKTTTPHFVSGNKTKLSFATPSLSAAKRFAGFGKNAVPPVPTFEYGQPVFDNSQGYVYQVEPVDKEDLESTWSRRMKYFNPPTTEVVSNKGFRVIKKVHPK